MDATIEPKGVIVMPLSDQRISAVLSDHVFRN